MVGGGGDGCFSGKVDWLGIERGFETVKGGLFCAQEVLFTRVS